MSRPNSQTYNYKYYEGPKCFGTSARSNKLIIKLLGLIKAIGLFLDLGLILPSDLIKPIHPNGMSDTQLEEIHFYKNTIFPTQYKQITHQNLI